MIKVAIDCHKLEDQTENKRAGIGRHLYKLLEEINSRPELKKEFVFYLYFKGSIPKIDFLESEMFVKQIAKFPFYLPFFRPSYNIFFHIALPLYVLKDRINVTFFPSFMMPLFFIGKSLAILTNDVFYEYKYGNLPFKYKIGYKLFANWAAKRATIITTYTNASRKEIQKHLGQKVFIFVNPLGVDVEEINKGIKDSQDGDYILFVGQTFPRRRLKETLLAYEKIAEDNKTLKFIIIGSDKYNPPIIDKLITKINSKIGNRIKHIQSVTDEELFKLYSRTKLLIYISNCEAMGLPPLEALATGTPSLVADNNLTREIFEESAFFVKEYDNPDKIAEQINNALTNKLSRDKIIKNSNKILSKYTWQKHTDKFLQALRSIIC